MLTEFFTHDDSLRYYAVIPFSLGIAVIAYYYFGILFRHWRIGVRRKAL
jgi:hypothetical protein